MIVKICINDNHFEVFKIKIDNKSYVAIKDILTDEIMAIEYPLLKMKYGNLKKFVGTMIGGQLWYR